MLKDAAWHYRYLFPVSVTILIAERRGHPMPKPYQLLDAQDFERPSRQAIRPRMSEEEREYYRRMFAEMEEQGKPGGVIPLEEGEDPRRIKLQAKSVAKDIGLSIRFVRPEKGSHTLKLRRQTEEEIAKNRQRGERLHPRQARPEETSSDSSGDSAAAPSRRRATSEA